MSIGFTGGEALHASPWIGILNSLGLLSSTSFNCFNLPSAHMFWFKAYPNGIRSNLPSMGPWSQQKLRRDNPSVLARHVYLYAYIYIDIVYYTFIYKYIIHDISIYIYILHYTQYMQYIIHDYIYNEWYIYICIHIYIYNIYYPEIYYISYK